MKRLLIITFIFSLTLSSCEKDPTSDQTGSNVTTPSQGVVHLMLKDIYSGHYPADSDNWIIEDVEAIVTDTRNDFEGLQAVLKELKNSGREISLCFPNLKELPFSALKSCSVLTSVSLPKATTIGDSAFGFCNALTTVSLPMVETFDWSWIDGSSKVSSVTIKNITYIADNGAFYNSDKSILYKYFDRGYVSEFIAPNSVKELSNSAFRYCNNLTTVSLPEVMTIGNSAFSRCEALTTVSLPAATTIGRSAFYDCEALTTVSLPAVTTIGDYAFNSCDALTTVSLPEAMAIGNSAFYGCDALTTVSLPMVKTFDWSWIAESKKVSSVTIENVTYIADNGAFYNTDKTILYKYLDRGCVSEFIAPNSVKEISHFAFRYCDALTTVSLPEATAIGNYAFINCDALTTVLISEATKIGDYAFYDCDALTTVSLSAATTIGRSAFYDCNALTTVSLPAATTIGGSAFYDCNALTKVSLPKATTIGDSALGYCDALTSVKIATESVLTSVVVCFVFNNTNTLDIDLSIGAANNNIVGNSWNGCEFKYITRL